MALTSFMINNLITPYHNYTSIPQNNIWTHFPWSISASMKKIAILELAQLLYFILILSWRRIISEFFAVQYEILETQIFFKFLQRSQCCHMCIQIWQWPTREKEISTATLNISSKKEEVPLLCRAQKSFIFDSFDRVWNKDFSTEVSSET